MPTASLDPRECRSTIGREREKDDTERGARKERARRRDRPLRSMLSPLSPLSSPALAFPDSDLALLPAPASASAATRASRARPAMMNFGFKKTRERATKDGRRVRSDFLPLVFFVPTSPLSLLALVSPRIRKKTRALRLQNKRERSKPQTERKEKRRALPVRRPPRGRERKRKDSLVSPCRLERVQNLRRCGLSPA